MKEKIYTIYASSITILGFFLQLINVNNIIKDIILGLFVLSLILLSCILFLINEEHLISHHKLIERGNNFIISASRKVVIFSGDLSWIDYYFNSIETILSQNKIVEIFLPKSIYDICKEKEDFLVCIVKLLNIKADIFVYENDEGLRGMLLDPDTYNYPDAMEIMIANKLHTNIRFIKGMYILKHYKYFIESKRNVCKLYISLYRYLNSIKKSINQDTLL